ncbi:MAG: hypothetical protein ACT4RN_02645 [Pseudonocardia sp.]
MQTAADKATKKATNTVTTNTVTRLVAYGGALVLAFGLAWGIGSAAGPDGGARPAGAAAGHDHGAGASGGGHAHGGAGAAEHGPGGLAVTEAGYTLAARAATFSPGAPAEFAFSITGSDGRPVTAFDVEHDKRMHLVVVRRDATGFQHLHPELGTDGVWRTPLTLPTGGVYRAFADFVPTGGPALTLGTDLFVPGEFAPAAPAPARVATVDGYQVTLEGELVGGGSSQLVATVTRGGLPVTDLEPYLGAFGHLVALRRDDLAYLHVHPNAAAPPRPGDRAGPQVTFTAEVPSAGTYRLFLDFSHGGVVRTAEFTTTAAGPPTAG